MAEASEVVFSIEMNSLPVGGTMTRMAWGSTMRRIVSNGVMPRAWAASTWPGSTERIPARTISAMNGVMKSTIRAEYSVVWMKGRVTSMLFQTDGTPLYQKKSCTRTGVPRKNQM